MRVQASSLGHACMHVAHGAQVNPIQPTSVGRTHLLFATRGSDALAAPWKCTSALLDRAACKNGQGTQDERVQARTTCATHPMSAGRTRTL